MICLPLDLKEWKQYKSREQDAHQQPSSPPFPPNTSRVVYQGAQEEPTFQGDQVKSGILSTTYHDFDPQEAILPAVTWPPCPAPSFILPVHILSICFTPNSKPFPQQKAVTTANLESERP